MGNYIEIQLNSFSRIAFKTKEFYEAWLGSEQEVEDRTRAELGRLASLYEDCRAMRKL